MLVGYMRVSSDGDRQTTALQRDALLAAGVDDRHLFEDKASGAGADHPGLEKALAFARSGDCLIVWKLDRLGRSLPHLLNIVTGLRECSVAFRSQADLIKRIDSQSAFLKDLTVAVAQLGINLPLDLVQAIDDNLDIPHRTNGHANGADPA